MHGPRSLVLALIVCLIWAPVAPAFALAGMDGPPAADADVADRHQHHGAPTAGAADTAHADGQTTCADHDDCNGQCCAACVQCFNALTSLHPIFYRATASARAELRVVYRSLVPRMLERPPQPLLA